jgi:DnaJ family protein C protein 13
LDQSSFFYVWQSAEHLGCHRILEIVITLVKANKTAMSHLYKLGAFEILLWKLLAGDIVDWDKSRIAEFLSQSHLLQELTTTDNGSGQSEHGTWRDSILHLYLPEGLILNLVSEVFHTDPV